METKIILIVGASGVGKDSLLKASLEQLPHTNVIQRYITRKPDENENNHFLSQEAFSQKVHEDEFISFWSAHGNNYGIAKEDIKEGLNIISVSRGSIVDFEKLYDKVLTLHVTLPKEVLRTRLMHRARESSFEIEKRLNRTYESICAKNLVEFDNSLCLEKSAQAFVRIIKDF
jgi:phosphonate metabolism protein PhnN/1,5-bisphosphokinase (PRPP-forming)